MPRAWLCLAFGSERQYVGNDGCKDQVSNCYLFDSLVPNDKQIMEGDVLVILDRSKVLGAANVTSLHSSAGSKNMQRCPECRTSSIKMRTTVAPAFRCKAGHEFAGVAPI